MKNKSRDIAKVAIFKGAIHASIAPIIIAIITNMAIKGWGPTAGLIYLLFAAVVYYNSKNKDISKKVFFFIIKGYSVFILFLSMVTIVLIVI